MKYLQLIRVNNWVKNLFIFLPLFFSAEILDGAKFLTTSLTVLAFSLVTSCIYIINDIYDVQFDRIHPTKKFRPIAAEQISIRKAALIGVGLAVIGLLLLLYISKVSFFLTVIYAVLNIAYSLKLKHIPIIDFVVVSLGFVIRVLIGGDVTDVILSQWILVMVLLLSLFIAVCKRRDDVLQYEIDSNVHRRVVTKYTVEFMDKVISITSSVLIVSYLLFITSADVIQRYNSRFLMVSFLFVLIGVFRYNHLTYVYNMTGSPIRLLFRDRFLQICLFCWFCTYAFVLYMDNLMTWFV